MSRTKRLFHVLLPAATAVSLFYVPWPILGAWLPPLPDSVEAHLEASAERALDGIVVYADFCDGAPVTAAVGLHDPALGLLARTDGLDLAYAQWPAGQSIWSVAFSLDGECTGEGADWEQLLGCTDAAATNFNPEAVVDDGSCAFGLMCGRDYEVEFALNGGLDPDEVELTVSNDAGDMPMEMNGYTGSSVGCVPSGCYTVEMLDSAGDGWEGASAEL